jgi:hypothetical protein
MRSLIGRQAVNVGWRRIVDGTTSRLNVPQSPAMKATGLLILVVLVTFAGCGSDQSKAASDFCGHLEELQGSVDREFSGSQVPASAFRTYEEQFTTDADKFQADGDTEMSGAADGLARASSRFAAAIDGGGLIPAREGMEQAIDDVPNGFCRN